MRKIVLICFALLLGAGSAFGWGEKGHNATARIAQKHLSCRAERRITRLLEGHNMAYWSSWADALRDDDSFDFINTWHYANADEGYTYATSPKHPDGDVYTAVEECIAQISRKGQSDSVRSVYLKLLIHFVGDMHCPMHAGRAGDRGGNDYEVDLRGVATNLHRLWDSVLINDAHTWSAAEWADNIDYKMTRGERKVIAAGTPLTWMEETVALSHAIYEGTPHDETLSWSYVNKYSPLIEEQLLEGGLRLAEILNELF